MRVVAACLLVLLTSRAAFAGIQIQNANSKGNTATSVNLALGSAPTNGDVMVASLIANGTAAATSVKDSNSVAFTQRGNYGTGGANASIWDYVVTGSPTATFTCAGGASTCFDFALVQLRYVTYSARGQGNNTGQTVPGNPGSIAVCSLGQIATSTATSITITNSTGQTNVLVDAEGSSGAGMFVSYAFQSSGTAYTACAASNSGTSNIVIANYNGNHGLLLEGVGFTPEARTWDSRLQDLYTMGFEPDWQTAA